MYAGAGWRGQLAGTALLILCLVTAGATDARADSRHAAFVVDANTGRILHAADADAERYPASLTKLMTLYLVFEQMEAGKLTNATPIKISAQAAAVPPSKLDLDPGDTIPLGAAIRVLVTKSANDIAVAIAEHISGSEAAFARAMTAKARQLGMRATVFRNAHGLPDREQVTTARDIATLSLALYDHFPEHARIFATRTFSYEGATYRNHNTMLGSFEGMEGIKTGYTRASGFNLSASARRNGRHVIAVVMGGRTAAARNTAMRSLLTRALARASTRRSRRPVAIARAEPAVAPPLPTPAPRLVEPIRPAVAPNRAEEEPTIHMARVRTVPIVQAPRASQWYQAAPASRAVDAERPLQPDEQYLMPEAGRGARPSTLDSQARRLDSGQPAIYAAQFGTPESARSAAPQAYAPPSYAGAATAGDYAVQVGAFATAGEAEARLRDVRQAAGRLLAAATDLTEPVAQGDRTLYRARFAGLEAGPAARTCNALRRQLVDCFVTRMR
jgi:D-alanyl-D-alanine carboxypeptidase